MEARLTFKYDRAADILYIDKVPPTRNKRRRNWEMT
jgi:uncharacterized protein YuzE